MKVPYGEGLATHTGPESCVFIPRGISRSVDRGTNGLGIEPRKTHFPRRRPFGTKGKATWSGAFWRAPHPARRGRRPYARLEALCAETGRSLVRPLCVAVGNSGMRGPHREGLMGRSR